jgi:hypothetical protein
MAIIYFEHVEREGQRERERDKGFGKNTVLSMI